MSHLGHPATIVTKIPESWAVVWKNPFLRILIVIISSFMSMLSGALDEHRMSRHAILLYEVLPHPFVVHPETITRSLSNTCEENVNRYAKHRRVSYNPEIIQ